jgi:hypothetical protein
LVRPIPSRLPIRLLDHLTADLPAVSHGYPSRCPLLSERGIPDALSEVQWPSPPRQPQHGPADYAEFVTCDQTIEVPHRVLKQKVPVGLVPHVQARLLARHLRGDLAEYPPFVIR